jgi:hypothetical protein
MNYLWELHYGGWAAPNIYFLGYSGAASSLVQPRPVAGVLTQGNRRMVAAHGFSAAEQPHAT